MYSFKRLSFANGWLWHSEVKLIGSSSLTTENWNTSKPFIKYFFFSFYSSIHIMTHMLVLSIPWHFSYTIDTHTHAHTLEWKLIFRPAQCQGLLSMGEANLIYLLLVKLFYHSTPDTIRGLSGLCAWALKRVTEDGNWWYIVQSFPSQGKAILLASHCRQ